MKQQNSTIKVRLSILLLLSIICSSSALIEKWVGKGEAYATIEAAIGSLPKPASEDVRILVTIPPEGWVEENLDINVTGILSSPAALTVEYVDKSTTTFYVGDDLEYRRNNNKYTVIEKYSGTELVSNRTYTIDDANNDAATAQNQYFIKNHLGSTVTLVDKDGKCVAPVYDYFAYGKQIAENTSPQQVTQTFTGKELDLFEKNTATGDDGEGLYYFGVRYYDADVGLWTAVDPEEQFVDGYNYCGNNPINRTDPDGSFAPLVAYAMVMAADMPEVMADLNFAAMTGDPIAGVAALIPGVTGVEVKLGKEIGFKSFSALKRYLGSAGEGKAWHHIVEQTPANIKKFGAEAIQNTKNIVRVDHGKGSVHAKVSGNYSSKVAGTDMTKRQIVGQKDFSGQFVEGMKTLFNFAKQETK